MKAHTCAIGIFAREPIAGQTKTRLIPLLGAEGAAAFHQRCIEATLRIAHTAGLGEVMMFVTPALQHESFFYTLPNVPTCVQQHGDDLGARMHNAFVHGLAKFARMIIVGTDCPALTAAHLRSVDAWLSANDGACFIPAEDGGYVLVAMAQPHAPLFAGIDWGTESVMAQTRAAAKNADIILHEMPPLADIDTPGDYMKIAGNARFTDFFKDIDK